MDRHYRQTADLVRLLVLTGARRDELRRAKTTDLDHHRRLLNAPVNKERNEFKTILLGSSDWAICAALKLATNTDWLFPSLRLRDGPKAPPRKPWDDIRTWSKMAPGFTLHDLRHTFASAGLALGYSLDQLGGILGHADSSTTQNYAYLLDDPRAAAITEIDQAVGRALQARN